MDSHNLTRKTCPTCHEEKTREDFFKDKTKKDGLCSTCKLCRYKNHKKWVANHPDKVKTHDLKWRKKNAEKVKTNHANYHKSHMDQCRLVNAKWRENHPEQMRLIRQRTFKKKYSTPQGNLSSRMSSAIRKAIGSNKAGKRWETLVGYSLDQLKMHLESLFVEGMSWDLFTQGNSQIDIHHIIPKSTFEYTNADDPEFKKCWSLSNLVPIWKTEHIKIHSAQSLK